MKIHFISKSVTIFLFTLLCLCGYSYLSMAHSAPSPQELYVQATNCQKQLVESGKGKAARSNWNPCIQKAKAIYEMKPKGGWAAAGLYLTGSFYEEAYHNFNQPNDLNDAKKAYEQLIRDFPTSAYAKRAKDAVQKLEGPAPSPSVSVASPPPVAEEISLAPASTASDRQLTGIRYSNTTEKLRLVFDLTSEVNYSYRYNKGSSKDPKPTLLIELPKTGLSSSAARYLSLRNQRVEDIQVNYGEQGTLLVTVKLSENASFSFITLQNPYRLVVDITTEGTSTSSPPASSNTDTEIPPVASPPVVPQTKPPVSTGKIKRIVLDPGHGGKDPGALGAIRGVTEKDIVLSIGRRLAEKIRTQLGWEVIMTRSTDVYITLQGRTQIANQKQADLFVSIHNNSAKNSAAYGIETYFLNVAKDKESIRVAAIENATSQEDVSDLQLILNDLMRNAKVTESNRLASVIQTSLIQNLSKKYTRINSRGVKQAPFYVLLGAHMPAVLLELSFISNAEECQRLITAEYQEAICDALVEALAKYEREMGPMGPGT